MALETGTYISDLNAANPTSDDPQSAGDNHIRLLKATVKATFPNVTGAVTPTHTELNYVAGVTSAIQTQIIAKAAHAGQVYTGTHDFTGATCDVATASVGAAGSAAASLDFVNAMALSTSAELPGQTGSAGKYLGTDGTNASWQIVRDIQDFSVDGTWTKPDDVKHVMVELWGAGGGGGSGRRGAAGSGRSGGGGAAGGEYAMMLYRAADLTNTVAVTVGAGGTGGAAVTADSTDGNDGTAGGNTTFGTYQTTTGGALGSKGTATNGSAGTGATFSSALYGEEGKNGGAGDDGNPGEGTRSFLSGRGGGGGGGIASTNTPVAGDAGGGQLTTVGVTTGGGGAAGTGDGGVGAAGVTVAGQPSGTGGGGGSYGAAAAAGAGGNGGVASGGGGGGGSLNSYASGKGGNGGNGYARITSW